jgi:ribonuclease BN (tRNA processing enzyme)
MRLTTVGTGTAAPHARRVQSATFVEAGDVRLLIDCGSGATYRMAELGIPWERITHVAFTHFHADHTSDLATLIYGWRYGLLQPRSDPIQIIGPLGLGERIAGMMTAFGATLLENPPPLTLVELPPGAEVRLSQDQDVVLSSRKVPHAEESVAYSVSGAGRRIVVTGDTGFDAGLGAWASGCDLLLCECSLPDSLAVPHHLTPRQCGALAAIARPGALALTHFYHPVESEPIGAQVAESFDGPVVLCEDGWSTTIGTL